VPPRRPRHPARVAAPLLGGALTLPAAAAPGGTGRDSGLTLLWAGVAGPGSSEQWRPLGAHPDTQTCEATRRDALQAAWKGLREVGVLELVPLGTAGFTRVDPRTLETYTFRFACRPGPASAVTPNP
jgi:hypothetical protein